MYPSTDKAMENQSITRRLMASLVITILAVSLIAVTAMYRVVSQAATRSLEQKADETLSYLVGSLEVPLWTLDEDGIEMIGRAVSQDESVVRLIIRNEFGEIIYSMEKEKSGDLINRSAKIFHKERDIQNLEGEASVSLTQAIYKASHRQLLLFSILILFLILVSVGIVAVIIVRTSLNRPLKRLSELANRFASGTYDTSGHTLPYLEFQPFGRALVQMAGEIQQQIRMIQEAEAKYRDIFENAIEGIFQSTVEGRLLNTNPALAGILGYGSRDELLASGSHFPNDFHVDPEERGRLLSCILERGLVTGYEVQFRRRDGQGIWASISARMVRDESGIPLLVEGFLTEISDRKRAEEDIRKLNVELEGRVQERTTALEEKNTQLERMNRLFVGRELRMIELKERIKKLEERQT